MPEPTHLAECHAPSRGPDWCCCDALRAEMKANGLVEDAIDMLVEAIQLRYRTRDEYAGMALVMQIASGLVEGGCRVYPVNWIPPDHEASSRSRKQRISYSLLTKVYERDAYRCVTCKTHLDLTCDHVIPESAGGPTTLENLQTMCRTCNCRKGVKSASGVH